MHKVGDQVDAEEEDYGVRQTVGDCMGFHTKSGVHVRQSRPCQGGGAAVYMRVPFDRR